MADDDTKGDGSGEEDMVANEPTTLELPLSMRLSRRAALEGVLDTETLNTIYGEDSAPYEPHDGQTDDGEDDGELPDEDEENDPED